jgi:hypothetical protein
MILLMLQYRRHTVRDKVKHFEENKGIACTKSFNDRESMLFWLLLSILVPCFLYVGTFSMIMYKEKGKKKKRKNNNN